MAFLDKLKSGLAKTKDALFKQVDNLLKSFVKVDEDLIDELEELLISADLGVNTTEEILDNLRDAVKYKVEEFTGMPVEKINILVEGVRVID